MLEAFLQELDPIRMLVGIGSQDRFRSTRAQVNNQAFDRARQTPCPLNWVIASHQFFPGNRR
jgi:hypothetical protein